MELLVLGSLRYLGRGWTFDDLEEATGISEESHRVFFHRFISCGRKFLFPKWVKAPQTASEIEESMSEYAAAISVTLTRVEALKAFEMKPFMEIVIQEAFLRSTNMVIARASILVYIATFFKTSKR